MDVLLQTGQDKQARLLSTDAGHFSLVRALHLADYITELNGFCGVMSILSSMRYCLGDPSDVGNLWAALTFIPFGLFFDFMDGKVARWRGKASLMGQELDSLADLVCEPLRPLQLSLCYSLRTLPREHKTVSLTNPSPNSSFHSACPPPPPPSPSAFARRPTTSSSPSSSSAASPGSRAST